MPMRNKGLNKVVEEFGEALTEVGKVLEYGLVEHPDKKGHLKHRLENEFGDAMASMSYAIEKLGLDYGAIALRTEQKLALYESWTNEP